MMVAQKDSTTQETYYDHTDLRKVIGGKKKADEVTPLPKKGKLMLFIVPAVGTNPSLGAFYGLAATGAMFVGDPETTNISSLSASALFTTKDQFIASIKGTIMTPEDSWEILTDIRYSYFSENTYGLGSDYNQAVHEDWVVGGSTTSGIAGAQPMTFNNARFHIIPLKKITGSLFVGVGYHFDTHYAIKDLSLDLTATNPVITSHYYYSIQKGFNPEHYVTAGTSLNVVYDTRDHVVSPYQGSFLHLSYRTNSEFLGSVAGSQVLYAEARHFVSLSKEMPRHVLGFWGIGQILTAGHLPYLDLPASGYDMRNRIGRGYVGARFRGPAWVTLESEYRFPITKNGLLGGVVFANVTTTSRDANTDQAAGINAPPLALFDAVRPAAGFGARVSLNRTGRLNIVLDMAFGQNGSKGFYFAVGETF